MEWLLRHGFRPCYAHEWDDLVVDFKNLQKVSRSQFGQLVSSIEFFFPRFKGQLVWSRAVLSGWDFSSSIKHAVPLGKGLVHVYCVHLASAGHPRLGFGMVLQLAKGMRPRDA